MMEYLEEIEARQSVYPETIWKHWDPVEPRSQVSEAVAWGELIPSSWIQGNKQMPRDNGLALFQRQIQEPRIMVPSH
jgi:hypothetical protein